MTETLTQGAANQTGAIINKDAYAEAQDFLPLKGIDHVEFWVGNARQASAYFRALWGFTPTAFSGLETKVRDRASYVIQQNDIRFVLTAPLTPEGEIAEHVHHHGDGVKDIAFAVDDVESAWRETTSRGAVSVLEPTEFDGGEDGVLRKSAVRTYGDVIHSFVDRNDYHGVVRARLSQDQEPGRGRRRAVAARGRPLRGQRVAGRDEQVRRLLPRRVRLLAADPLRRQGHPHRLLGADVQGDDQRQRPDQVPDQRAGDGQEEEPDPGIPRLVPVVGLPAHRAPDGGHRRHGPPAARERRRVPGHAARVLRGTPRPRRRRRRADRDARGAGHRGRSRRGGLPAPDLHPARSRIGRRSSSRSSSATARAASASATSRRCSRRSSASRRCAATSDRRA